MIRQAITCDICASEKKQTNHWFVAYEQGGELRVSGWSSRNRQRAGAKHLCGQTCLHKLVDDFVARTIQRAPLSSEVGEAEAEAMPTVAIHATDTRSAVATHATDTSLTVQPNAHACLDEFESSARLITPPAAIAVAAVSKPARAPAELVQMPERIASEERQETPAEAPRYSSRNWRSEAWERERERELRAAARLRSSG